MNNDIIPYCAISFDTCYLESQKYNFDGATLSTLKQFTKENSPRIVLTNIVVQEIKKHIKKGYEDLYKAIFSFKRDFSFREFDTTFILNETNKNFENFINNLKIEILTADMYPISIDKIIDSYFKKQPPFSEKKKDEFPDAISLEILEEYGKRNNAKVAIVSRDNDWKDFAEKSNVLEYFKSLPDAIAAIQSNEAIHISKTKLESIFEQTAVLKRNISSFLSDTDISMPLEKELNKKVSDFEINDYNFFSYIYFTNITAERYDIQYDTLEVLLNQGNFKIICFNIEVDAKAFYIAQSHQYNPVDDDFSYSNESDGDKNIQIDAKCIIALEEKAQEVDFNIISVELSEIEITNNIDVSDIEELFKITY